MGSITVDDVRVLVAEYATADLADPGVRERARANWLVILRVVFDAEPGWALAYIPGVSYDNALVFAVHKSSRCVLGGECPVSGQRMRESTQAWLARLDQRMS